MTAYVHSGWKSANDRGHSRISIRRGHTRSSQDLEFVEEEKIRGPARTPSPRGYSRMFSDIRRHSVFNFCDRNSRFFQKHLNSGLGFRIKILHAIPFADFRGLSPMFIFQFLLSAFFLIKENWFRISCQKIHAIRCTPPSFLGS